MSYHPIGGQSRICITQRSHDPGECVILGRFVGNSVRAFQFHADREVIASRAALIAGLAGMPCSIGKFYELRQAAVSRHQQVRRHPQFTYFGKIGMQIERQRIREQPVYPGAAEFSGRQADAVHDDQIRRDPLRASIVIWRSDLPGASHQSAFEIDLQVLAFFASDEL